MNDLPPYSRFVLEELLAMKLNPFPKIVGVISAAAATVGAACAPSVVESVQAIGHLVGAGHAVDAYATVAPHVLVILGAAGALLSHSLTGSGGKPAGTG